MKLSDIRPNPSNPRTISKTKFEKLKRSLQEFSKMMELRPMVVNADGIVLGGNQRLAVLEALGYDEIPDSWVRRADDLTPEEQRRFIVADNLAFGEWDFDLLAASFEVEELQDWGFTQEEIFGAGLQVPDFQPVDESEQPRLDQKAPVTCPECGAEFVPK